MMDIWNDDIMPRLLTLARADEDYQTLFRECEEKRMLYEQAVRELTLEEYDLIEDYIASCEELEYRMTQLAFFLGKSCSGCC